VFAASLQEAWEAYRTVNRAFAEAAAEAAPEGAAVLMQDYHVALAGPILARQRPDLRIVHFSHTPFAGPEGLRVLPPAVRQEWLTAMAGHHACGFHTRRWADAFIASCAADGVATPNVFVSPLAPDPEDIEGVASSEECAEAVAELDRQLGDRLLLTRVDRIEPSKNIVRGFLAFDSLLETHPEWRSRVVFGAFVYPSREALAAYRNYRTEVEGIIKRLNARWGTDDWTPVHYDPSDHFPRSVAALRRADVLLVNPLRDGLNLVAKEGAMVNEHDAVVVLSTEAGAWDELAAEVIGVHPFDIVGTAEALHTALSMPRDERAALAARLRARSTARTPADWLREQLAAAG
jgi:trehalose 6-phosphate synthase